MWLNRTHGVDGVPSDAELDAMLAATGLAVVEGCRFTGRVREVYAAGLLGIRAGLPAGWVRWLKAHGLGHHLLHRGNHLYRRGRLHLWQRHEVEAELFAGGLLFPDGAGGRPTLHEVATGLRVATEQERTPRRARLGNGRL
ncbi:MAG TPA: hypothetical protein VG370_02830 [Chloroflexota bacterium]|jgi:hypothetical protein|nr:hypothetical protein [Chloroflexota bacterium]